VEKKWRDNGTVLLGKKRKRVEIIGSIASIQDARAR